MVPPLRLRAPAVVIAGLVSRNRAADDARLALVQYVTALADSHEIAPERVLGVDERTGELLIAPLPEPEDPDA